MGFLAGAGLGTLVSVLTWVPGFDVLGGLADKYGLWLLPLLKLCFGVVFAAIPKSRGFGVGVLVSIPIGFLVFFGSCVSAFNNPRPW